MKTLTVAVVTAALSLAATSHVFAQAQSAEQIRQLCYNKYNTGKYGMTAPENVRKEVDAKRRACIASGGKS